MESSTGGCNGRVCRNVYPLASLLERGYVPVRFRALAEDNTTVSASVYQQRPDSPSNSPAGGSKRPIHQKRWTSATRSATNYPRADHDNNYFSFTVAYMPKLVEAGW